MPLSLQFFCDIKSALQSYLLTNRSLHPSISALGEDIVEVAFEERAGIFQVRFGFDRGEGDVFKRFVENTHNPLLFGEGRQRNFHLF